MALSPAFISQLQALLPDEWNDLVKAITSTPPVVSVRVNPLRNASVPPTAQRVPWWQQGFYCDERPQFTFDTQFHSGMYYVQDASSMFVAHLIKCLIDKPVCYLDLCAAPGGKSTAALDALPSGSLVVANEIVPSRARILHDNITKWGHPNAVATNNAPKAFGNLGAIFDVVAVDAPCSGEGMMRKDDEAVAQWTPALVTECAARQRQILTDVWPALKEGGLLIYSTCTFNRQENEDMVQFIVDELGAEPIAVPVDPQWHIHQGIDTPHEAYRFLPHLVRGEGLFMAVLRKTGGIIGKTPKLPRITPCNNLPKQVADWFQHKSSFHLTMNGNQAIAWPTDWAALISLMNSNLNVFQSGIALGTLKGKNCIPEHGLSLSVMLNKNAFSTCEIDYSTSMAYLRGEAISIDAPRGYVLITHRQVPLGWANNLGNRTNNLYPKSLRIISQRFPDTEPQILIR